MRAFSGSGKIKEFKSEAAVIMITAYGDIDLAVRSLKEGAADFVVKPWHNEKLIITIKEALKRKEERPHPRRQLPGADSIIGTELLGESEVMQDIFYKIEKIAPTDANILILGENGTGKDLIAKAIHQQSLRSDKAYVKVDVGSLTESLFESELFGHKKGAFTDAREDRVGRFEAANGGTLFLDEIGNIPSAPAGQTAERIAEPAGGAPGHQRCRWLSISASFALPTCRWRNWPTRTVSGRTLSTVSIRWRSWCRHCANVAMISFCWPNISAKVYSNKYLQTGTGVRYQSDGEIAAAIIIPAISGSCNIPSSGR